MFSDKFKTTWVEFNSPVYVGQDGYVDSLKLDTDPAVAPHRVLAVSHFQERGMWFFILPDGKCVGVPNSNIRYVYGGLMDFGPALIQTSADAVAEDAPKKRGRPAKDKA